jgi:hypothetical protein
LRASAHPRHPEHRLERSRFLDAGNGIVNVIDRVLVPR